MASESLSTGVARHSTVKSLPNWYIRREVTFRYSIPVMMQPALTTFVVDYIEKMSNAIGVAVKFHESPSMVRILHPQMSVQIVLLDDWTPWSPMPLDWTESFESIIDEALEAALKKGLLPPNEIWTVSAPNSSCVSPDEPVQSLQASESVPSDLAKQSNSFSLPVVREVTFTTPIKPDQQQPLAQFVEEHVLKYEPKTSNNCILVYVKFELTGELLQSQMTVTVLLQQDWKPPVPVPSGLKDYYYTIIDKALHDALDRGLLPKDETWFTGASGIWRATLPEDEPAQLRVQESVASERLTSERVPKQSHKLPIPSADREVSFWIGILPNLQSGLVEFVKKHIHEQYGALVRATAEFMYPKGLLAQNQMMVTISILASWRPPPPVHSDRTKYVDSIINETLLAAVAERRLPLLERWTISDPGGWGIIPRVEPVQRPAKLPPVAFVGSDISTVQRSIAFVLEVNFDIPIPADQLRNLVKFLATDIKVTLLVANADVTVQFKYSTLFANKMVVTIRLCLDSKVPQSWPNSQAMVDQALREVLKRGLLPDGETWEITLSYPLRPHWGMGRASIDVPCHSLHSPQDRMVSQLR